MKAILLLIVFAAVVSAETCEVAGPKCLGCKTIIGSIERLLTSNKTEEFITDFVEKYVIFIIFLFFIVFYIYAYID